jgi:hypothetical protein
MSRPCHHHHPDKPKTEWAVFLRKVGDVLRILFMAGVLGVVATGIAAGAFLAGVIGVFATGDTFLAGVLGVVATGIAAGAFLAGVLGAFATGDTFLAGVLGVFTAKAV